MLVEISAYIHDKIINVMIRCILLIINILCHFQALVTNFALSSLSQGLLKLICNLRTFQRVEGPARILK
jgi:hypothetical protein